MPNQNEFIDRLKASGDPQWIALGYLLENIQSEIATVKQGVVDGAYISRREFDREIKDLSERIGSLEDDRKWLIRTIMGVIVLAVLGVIIAQN